MRITGCRGRPASRSPSRAITRRRRTSRTSCRPRNMPSGTRASPGRARPSAASRKAICATAARSRRAPATWPIGINGRTNTTRHPEMGRVPQCLRTSLSVPAWRASPGRAHDREATDQGMAFDLELQVAKTFPTARGRGRFSSRSRRASSSRSSGRRAAARRRPCAWSPASRTTAPAISASAASASTSFRPSGARPR